MNPIKVLWVSAEASPYVKVGGLGDVAGALPVALHNSGVDIRRCIPLYGSIAAKFDYDSDVVVSTSWRKENVIIRKGHLDAVPTWLFDHANAFGRNAVYGYTDDAERFSLFCLAVFEWLKTSEFQPDIIHINDWHTAPLAILIKEKGRLLPSMHHLKTLLTIHSMAYQGLADRSLLHYLGLPDYLFSYEALEFYGAVNLLKGGILYADYINTVSPTYARELLKQGCGFGLEGVLFNKRQYFSGILNGIDLDLWDPSKKSILQANYSVDKLETRQVNRLDIEKRCRFTEDQQLIFGFVGRLVESKGLNLILGALPHLVSEGARFVFLGTGDIAFENALREAQRTYPKNVYVKIGFDEAFAVRIYGGADVFLMPSLFEPCGISQLMAMRYGCLPLVRKTGGLSDTVDTMNQDAATGFSFSVPTVEAFTRAARHAIKLWRELPEEWRAMQKRAMNKTFGWNESGHLYERLYQKLIGRG